jgi:hypothetical protein
VVGGRTAIREDQGRSARKLVRVTKSGPQRTGRDAMMATPIALHPRLSYGCSNFADCV